jgi:dTDP-4-amino-4,6-dideoxygalactose transaminase
MSRAAAGARQAVGDVLDLMPDPIARAQVSALETELAAEFGTSHAVAVSSGTAALHTALAACGIGHGDEVLVAAACVVMTVAAVVHAGAYPVFVDSGPTGIGLDLDDAAAKLTERTRAVIPVHLAGRCGDLDGVARFAADRGLRMIEDACQAHGSRYRERLAGTLGDAGCFSMKDGKLLWCGEGGYVLTNDAALAARAAGFRSHWQASVDDVAAGSRLGHNYRLAEPLAALARTNLTQLPEAIARRQEQTRLLHHAVAGTPGLDPVPVGPDERPNCYSPLWHVQLPRPREFCAQLVTRGVPNSVGTFGLTSADRHPACAPLSPPPCPTAAAAIDSRLAVIVSVTDTDQRLHDMAATIRAEAAAWPL